MSTPKTLLLGAFILFSAIAVTAYFKKSPQPTASHASTPHPETPVVSIVKQAPAASPLQPSSRDLSPRVPADDFPVIDRVFQLFTIGPSGPPGPHQLPIVETIDYTSTVSWLKGKPAWIADYAAHFGTSRHFIARSLNGKADYFSQAVREGSRFNVFRKDKKLQFYLLVDISRLKMGFYYLDVDTNERVLLKTYAVGLGRLDPSKVSGSLTPLGRYPLGHRVAIYKPGTLGHLQGNQVEMIRAFGTRWIPFGEEKGYGIYGAPWVLNQSGELFEECSCIGAYDTDGGIQMAACDLEELFAIVITKPTFVEIVKDFREARLPGIEVATPTR